MDTEDLRSRFTYHPPKDNATIAAHATVRDSARALAELLNDLLPEGREKSLAITRLEEVVMWGNAAIARNGGPADYPAVRLPDGPSETADPGGPTITLRLVEHGETTIEVDREEYADAIERGTFGHLLDAWASSIGTRTMVIEPDGTEYDLASGGAA